MKEQIEETLERWIYALESRGMKVTRTKTEYMCVNERELVNVEEFKYLWSTVQSNRECGRECPGLPCKRNFNLNGTSW